MWVWRSFVVEVDIGLDWRIPRLSWVDNWARGVRVEGNVGIGNAGNVGVE